MISKWVYLVWVEMELTSPIAALTVLCLVLAARKMLITRWGFSYCWEVLAQHQQCLSNILPLLPEVGWGWAQLGKGTQLGPLASIHQRDFPHRKLSAQIKKLSRGRCKWGAFIICNVCLLEQLLHMWKCSFPGSGQALLANGKVENFFWFCLFFCAHNLSLLV